MNYIKKEDIEDMAKNLIILLHWHASGEFTLFAIELVKMISAGEPYTTDRFKIAIQRSLHPEKVEMWK